MGARSLDWMGGPVGSLSFRLAADDPPRIGKLLNERSYPDARAGRAAARWGLGFPRQSQII